MKLERISDFILRIIILITTAVFIILTITLLVNLNNRTEKLEKSFYAPVVVTPSLDVSDEHTQDIVKQAYQYLCKNVLEQIIFEFKYDITFGGNEYGQLLIFITFYCDDDYDDYDTYKLVNYYENPQEWKVVWYE